MSEDNFDCLETSESESKANFNNPTTISFELGKLFKQLGQIKPCDRLEGLNILKNNNSNNILNTFQQEFTDDNIYDSDSDGNTYILIPEENNNENNFLNRMRERTINKEEEEEKEEEERQDNMRTAFGCNFFNKFITNKFRNFIKITKCGLCFEIFPKKIYKEATLKRSENYLDKTIEEFIVDEDLYKNDIKSKNKYDNNLKVINILKEDKYKDILNKNNFDNFLKKKFRDLIMVYLDSDEFKEKIDEIKQKKGNNKAKTFADVAKCFVEI